ncbi:PssD/Cps14F family polysaccharide biosynthesis glycosyltransferase [Photobacterium leiognathi]|uniref:PssD/Cps14F family polysaccharide biosynthesis glycosyltransferase n=1 Tax=Photobacterium leiognathi TaxID=553611 RepID=UPI00387F57F3
MRKRVNLLVCGNGGHQHEMDLLYSYMLNSTRFVDASPFILMTTSHHSRFNHLELINIMEVRSKESKISTLFLTPIAIIVNLFQLFRVLIRYKVCGVLSTGPGVAIIPIIICKLFRIKIVHIESMCRFYNISLSGRVIRLFADKFIVQNESLARKCKTFIYGGRL